jgi:hypothetical protein
MNRKFTEKRIKEHDRYIVRIESDGNYIEIAEKTLRNKDNKVIGFFGGGKFYSSGSADALIEAAKKRFKTLSMLSSLQNARMLYKHGFRLNRKPNWSLNDSLNYIGQNYVRMNWKKDRVLRRQK